MPVSWVVSLLLLVPCVSEVSRLRIVNGCDKEPLWVAHEAGRGIGPDPQNVRIAPLKAYDFKTPGGLTGTRYWPKMRCDKHGNACEIGESGGPKEVCDQDVKVGGCAPPVDTKFEATFGRGWEEDWVDMSLVDGFTLPFRFEMSGKCSAGFGNRRDSGNVVDCSRLSVDDCPSHEDMGHERSGVSLKVMHPKTHQVVGCYSPCSKLTLAQWGNKVAGDKHVTDPYCCPTPPESPAECRAGPVPDTAFVKAVHRMCPGVYAYSYDDGMGLLRCPSDTHYTVTFYCPNASKSSHLPRIPTPSPSPSPHRMRHEQLTWITMYALPKEEGETMHVGSSDVRHTEEMRRLCIDRALCVGFSYRPKTGEWYLKKMGTGFDASVAAWVRHKWGHEEWEFHYIRERSSGGPIRWVAQPNKCLSAAAGQSPGKLQLWDCTQGAGDQQFWQDVSGNVRWAAHPNMCLNVRDQKEANGNHIQLLECQSWDTNQVFQFPLSGAGKIRWADHPAMCLDVTDQRAENGNHIQLWNCCDGNDAQEFAPAGHGVQFMNEKHPSNNGREHATKGHQNPREGQRKGRRHKDGEEKHHEEFPEGASASAKRLRITNGCDQERLWLAYQFQGDSGPTTQNVKLEPMESHDFLTQGRFALGTWYWPKMRCTEQGDDCSVGGHVHLKGHCNPTLGCPSVDTGFKAVFGQNGAKDSISISLTDGFTLPFKFEMKGRCHIQSGSSEEATKVIDCSELSLDRCPRSERIGKTHLSLDLQAIHPESGEVVGCFSPCSKLGSGHNTTAHGCCPDLAASPEDCREGKTEYMKAVRRSCSGLSRTDAATELRCPGDTTYEATFYCPTSVVNRELPGAKAKVIGKQLHWAKHPDECLTVVERNARGLSMDKCNGTTNQKFLTEGTEGKIRSAAHPDLCIGIAKHEPYVRLGSCRSGATDMSVKGLESHAGRIRWASSPDMCLSVVDPHHQGDNIQLSMCSDEGSNQDFAMSDASWVHSSDSGRGKNDTPAHGQDLLNPTGAAKSSKHSHHGNRSMSRSRRLRITNGCDDEPIWIAHEVAGAGQQTSDFDPRNLKLEPLESYDFTTIGGIAGLQYWAKMNCDANGESCRVGERAAEDCGSQGCDSHVDTKLEAIFGINGGDIAFVSLTDGFTLPFKLAVKGECHTGSKVLSEHVIDCSRLSPETCPVAEDLGSAGSGVDLRAWDANKKQVVGCYSPCAKLQHTDLGFADLAGNYCCPTAEFEHSCQAGSTEYVQAVHKMCPEVNSHAFDSGMGPLRCRDTTLYELTFYCPARGRGNLNHHFGARFLDVLISKDAQLSAVILEWRHQPGVQLVAIAGFLALAVALNFAVRAGISWRRSRTSGIWQHLVHSPLLPD